MPKREPNILITSVGRRVQLVRFFQQAMNDLGLDRRVLAIDLDPSWSAAAHVADAAFRSPHVTDSGYQAFLLRLVEREEICLIIPMIDTELLVLAHMTSALRDLNCAVVVSDEALISICRDKRLSDGWFRSIGFETPEILDRCALTYPCFVKPYDGSMSVGARAILSAQMSSESMLADENLLFMRYFDPQQFDEFTVDAYYDRSGELKCLVPRKRVEVRSGEISKGLALKGKTYKYLWERLQAVEGARGCLTYQFFVSKAEDRWVASELNPRFGGGFPLSYAAGANYPEWLVREYLLGEEVPVFEDWQDRTAMVRYDSEIIFTPS